MICEEKEMKINMELVDVIKQEESKIAHQHGLENFKDIDRGEVTSRANGDILKTLAELEKNTGSGTHSLNE